MEYEKIVTAARFFADNYGYFIGGVAALAVAAKLRRRLKPTRAQRQHRFNQRQSYRDLDKLRAIDPVANPGRAINWLRKVNAYRFEEMILSELDRRQIKIKRNKSYSGDGGIDGQFVLGGRLWLVQAKRYSGFVKTEHIMAFDQICQEREALGLFVHTGKTPKQLSHLKRQIGSLRIISGDELCLFFAGKPVKLNMGSAQRQQEEPMAAGYYAPPLSQGFNDPIGQGAPSGMQWEEGRNGG